MKYAIKRKLSDLNFWLKRGYRKISGINLSTFMIAMIVMAVVIFLFSGGLYSLIVRPYPSVYYGGRFIFIYPQLSEQFISDTILSGFMYSIAFVGALMVYQSTRYVSRPRQAYLMLVAGAFMLIIAYVLLEVTIHIKLGS